MKPQIQLEDGRIIDFINSNEWAFLEQFLPDYYTSDKIAFINDIDSYLDGNEGFDQFDKYTPEQLDKIYTYILNKVRLEARSHFLSLLSENKIKLIKH